MTLRSNGTRREVLALGAAAFLSARGRALGAAVDSLRDQFPKTAKILAEAAARGGAGQFYLSRDGKVLADVGWGKTVSGSDVKPETIVPWASAVKPTTCVCLMKLWDKGKLDLDDKVTKFIPEFGVNGKEDVRLRHLLTHTAHLGGYPGPMNLSPKFEVMVNKIIQAPRTPYRNGSTLPPLGLGPGYNPAGIIVIAEICRRLYGKPFNEIVRTEVYEPCGMLDSWCGMPRERYRAYQAKGLIGVFAGRAGAAGDGGADGGGAASAALADRARIVAERSAAAGKAAAGEQTVSTTIANEDGAALIQPAGGGAGPTRELARFYEVMLQRGMWKGKRILMPQTVEAMTTPKTGLGFMGIWGLGFNLAMPEGVKMPSEPGSERLQNRYGTHCSQRTFGHAGASGMQAFADPEYGIATAFIGRAPIQDAIYEDLGVTK